MQISRRRFAFGEPPANVTQEIIENVTGLPHPPYPGRNRATHIRVITLGDASLSLTLICMQRSRRALTVKRDLAFT